jgi:hypothetical protein
LLNTVCLWFLIICFSWEERNIWNFSKELKARAKPSRQAQKVFFGGAAPPGPDGVHGGVKP